MVSESPTGVNFTPPKRMSAVIQVEDDQGELKPFLEIKGPADAVLAAISATMQPQRYITGLGAADVKQ